jgi:hypothetical protein
MLVRDDEELGTNVHGYHRERKKMINIDEEADKTLSKIEEEWPPSRCDLTTYRNFLQSLISSIQYRIELLAAEIGGDE